MLQRYKQSIILAITTLLSKVALAADIGEISKDLTKSVTSITRIVQVSCVVIGAGLITGSIITYRAHRQHPEEVSIFKPIFMLIGGAVLVLIGLLPAPKVL